MSKLEDFIHQNRSAFDDKEPGKNVWAKIESTLPAKPFSVWNSLALWRAAAMIFMVISVYLLIPKFTSTDVKNEAVALKEFQDVVAFYVAQIDQKEEQIEGFHNAEEADEFTQDFKQLEAMYSVLKEEMKTSPSKKVKDALVLNLLVRINLLNQQLYKLDNAASDKTKKKDADV